MSVFFVVVRVAMCVEAKTPELAVETALRHAPEEADNCDERNVSNPEVVTVEGLDGLPFGWRGSIPWGADDERTVRQRVEGRP